MANVAETASGEPGRRARPRAPASLRLNLPPIAPTVLAGVAAAALAALLLAPLLLAPLLAASPTRTAAMVMIGLGACGAAFAAARVGAALAARLDILRQALDAAPEALLVATADGQPVHTNAAFKRLFPGGLARPLEAIAQSAAADPAAAAEFRRLRDGAAARAGAAAVIAPADSGVEAAGRLGVMVSPLGRRQEFSLWTLRYGAPVRRPVKTNAAPAAIAQTRQPDQPVRRFFANAPIGIAVVDRGGRFVEANRALGDLFGAAPEDLLGRELIGWLNHGDRAAIAAKFGAAADGQAGREPVEVRLEGARDRTVVLLFSRLDDRSAAALGPTTGAPDAAAASAGGDDDPDGGLTLYFIDVTEQKSLESQFAQSQKMQAVGQLAGGVAHDFNNLLTAMIGFCDLLLLRSRPGDPAFADIMQIKQNANRAANLVRQLLAFSRQQTFQPRVLDITDVLVELSHLLRRLIGEDIALEVVHGRDLGLVKVDQGQLAGGVAHDFNNLLTAMIGFCDLLLLRSRPGDPAFADIMQIKQNANRAA
ncbi:MAG: PAS domain-containing protein, partial [Stellaceae bacterium]